MAILVWKENPAGRTVGQEEEWDMSAQGDLANSWAKAGYCTIKKAKPKVKAVESAPATSRISRKRKGR